MPHARSGSTNAGWGTKGICRSDMDHSFITGMEVVVVCAAINSIRNLGIEQLGCITIRIIALLVFFNTICSIQLNNLFAKRNLSIDFQYLEHVIQMQVDAEIS